MNFSKTTYIDRLCGKPLAWVLNWTARILGMLLRRDHSITVGNVRTIVVAKYLGMGSILQATPLIRSIRATFPRARIIFLTVRSCRPLVERLEHIDAVIVVDDRDVFRVLASTLRTAKTLVAARVDLYFDLEVYSAYASIMSLVSLSRNRFGFYRESVEHKKGLYTHLMYFNSQNPIRYIYLQLGRAAGCEPVEPDRLGRIRVETADRKMISASLAAAGIEQGRYLVVNPNASDLMIERRWPADRFAALIDRVLESYDLSVVLIGSRAERAYVAGVVGRALDGAGGRVVNLAGELSLGGLFALLEGARCVVTNDTGPMHMAWSLGTPTICMFGPVDPNHYSWAGPGVEILYKRLYCSPCVHQVDEPPCRGNNVCMQRIGVDEVAAAVERTLTKPSVGHVEAIESEYFLDPCWGPLGRVVRGSIEEAGREGAAPWSSLRSQGSPAVPAPCDGVLSLKARSELASARDRRGDSGGRLGGTGESPPLSESLSVPTAS